MDLNYVLGVRIRQSTLELLIGFRSFRKRTGQSV